MSNSDKFALLLGYALGVVLWLWLWWHVIGKIGYRGLARKLWLVGMCVPPFFGLVMIFLLLLPWPVYRQLRQLREQNKRLQPGSDIDEELKRLRSNS